eukprot:UN09733
MTRQQYEQQRIQTNLRLENQQQQQQTRNYSQQTTTTVEDPYLELEKLDEMYTTQLKRILDQPKKWISTIYTLLIYKNTQQFTLCDFLQSHADYIVSQIEHLKSQRTALLPAEHYSCGDLDKLQQQHLFELHQQKQGINN